MNVNSGMLQGEVTTNKLPGTTAEQWAADIAYQALLSGINWSRSYEWKVYLYTNDDDKRNGVSMEPFDHTGMGLPVIDVQDNIAYGEEFSWETGAEPLYIPQRRSKYEISMTLLDDEKGTLELFFEYWFNLVYNQVDSLGMFKGVLPLQKAVRLVRIIKKGSMLQNVYERYYYIFPIGTLMGGNKSDTSQPRQYNIQFRVAAYLNPNFTGRAPTWADAARNFIGNKLGISI